MNIYETLRLLKELKRHMRGKKLLLIWDGLPAHRSKVVNAYLKTQKHWLRAVRFPSYAPEVNPIEYLWGAMKKKYLGNCTPELSVIGKELRKCRKQVNDKELLRGFLKASGLYS